MHWLRVNFLLNWRIESWQGLLSALRRDSLKISTGHVFTALLGFFCGCQYCSGQNIVVGRISSRSRHVAEAETVWHSRGCMWCPGMRVSSEDRTYLSHCHIIYYLSKR